jgi:hypothetical protein
MAPELGHVVLLLLEERLMTSAGCPCESNVMSVKGDGTPDDRIMIADECLDNMASRGWTGVDGAGIVFVNFGSC